MARREGFEEASLLLVVEFAECFFEFRRIFIVALRGQDFVLALAKLRSFLLKRLDEVILLFCQWRKPLLVRFR